MVKQSKNCDYFVEALDIVSFFVKNGIPVSTFLLPPKTKKILFIARDECDFQDNADKFDQICRFFSDHFNVLVETSTAGKYANLSLLAFSPNLVVIFVKTFDQASVNTLRTLSVIPEQKSLLFVEDSIKSRVERQLKDLACHSFIVANSVPIEDTIPRLRRIFDN